MVKINILLGFIVFGAGCTNHPLQLNEKTPNFQNRNAAKDFTEYQAEFPGKWEKEPIHFPGNTNVWTGRFASGDEDKRLEVFVANTVATNKPKPNRHLYIWTRDKTNWDEIELLHKYNIKSPLIVCSDRPFIVFENIGGNIPFVDTKLYLYDLKKEMIKDIGRGYSVQVSPDRRKIIFCTSDGDGFNNISYWDIGVQRSRVLFSYTETDPGDGTTMFYRWSRDSRVVYFSGKIRSFGKNLTNGIIFPENFFYLVEEDNFVKLSPSDSAVVKWK